MLPFDKLTFCYMIFRYAVPKANVRRQGASVEEFELGEVGATQFAAIYAQSGLFGAK